MAKIDFPSSPINGQTYDQNGVYYTYDSTLGAWITAIVPKPLDNSKNTQIIFNDLTYANGSNGMVFDKTSNTAAFNNVAVVQNVSATYYYGNGAFLTGVSPPIDLSPAFNQANTAYDKANNALANTTNTVFSGNLITSGVVRSTGLQDSTGRLLLIKNSTGTVVWGN